MCTRGTHQWTLMTSIPDGNRGEERGDATEIFGSVVNPVSKAQ